MLSPAQLNWAQRLSSNYWHQRFDGAYRQVFGPGNGVVQTVTGFAEYAGTAPLVLAEGMTNAVGAAAGNVADQIRLRGEGRFEEADAAADVAGPQIAIGLEYAGLAAGGVGLLGPGVATGIIRIGEAGAAPVVNPGAARWVTPDRYEGVRQLSKILREAGVPRAGRLQVVQSFNDITMRVAKGGENVLRFFGGSPAAGGSLALGRYVIPTFLQGNVRSLLALPPTNTLTGLTQFTLRPGAIYFEGTTAVNFGLPGGGLQYFVPNLTDLLQLGAH